MTLNVEKLNSFQVATSVPRYFDKRTRIGNVSTAMQQLLIDFISPKV